MTVHFIGAGPGAPDLLTLRGRNIIASCPVCLYAGSLVPKAVLEHCPDGAKIVNTAPMDLDAIIEEIKAADAQGFDIARLHSGDLSVWSAMGEQLRRLKAEGIPFTVTPGVPSFSAAAAALGAELTLPGVAQSVVLTRTSGRASSMPDGESLENFGRTGATLAIHLSVGNMAKVVSELTPHYGADCPVAIVFRASWPDERIIHATLETIEAALEPDITRTALILVGPALKAEGFAESCLYSPDYDRRYRPQTADSPWSEWTEGDD
ncbi:precorrin-4 C(11)-methyltransferase [Marinibacterium profundimaris]|uniref:Precorrin-4 C11-methyltransferase n=1 Tax=Marinibacterium profundimaris TaxID=1679460 RepID=A0A225NP92_9RHOB|nr:precorrin-4 C(11)-methyltransferase [Marinibacterium profundimaris]OWU72949.1 precorrin-4 C11-methyltransferase [Marinibacterium profundimaris]